MAAFLCVMVGFGWGGSALIGRLSSGKGMILPVLIALGTMLVTLTVAFRQNYGTATRSELTFGLLAGISNGIGVLAFFSLVAGATAGKWEASRVLPISYVLVSSVIVIGARIFFAEALTTDKIIGLAFVVGAVWFLK